jgi:hypothetical protein
LSNADAEDEALIDLTETETGTTREQQSTIGTGSLNIIELAIRSDGVHFTTPAVRTASAAYTAASTAYRHEQVGAFALLLIWRNHWNSSQAGIEAEICAVASTYAPLLAASAEAVMTLNLLLTSEISIDHAGWRSGCVGFVC